MKEVKDQIAEWNKMLPTGRAVTHIEAERRAGEFLVASAKIAEWKHLLNEEKIKFISVQAAVYSECLSKGTAKTITENKISAEASIEYTKAREDLEFIDNDISYLKTYSDIYNNAHIMYRTLSKND